MHTSLLLDAEDENLVGFLLWLKLKAGVDLDILLHVYPVKKGELNLHHWQCY